MVFTRTASQLLASVVVTCPCSGYPTAHHDEVRDWLAGALTEICRDVESEPVLLHCKGESLPGRSANRQSDARVDIRAAGCWTRQQDAFFDVRVTHSKADQLSHAEVISQLKRNEKEKKRQYGSRIIQIDDGTYMPLAFTTSCQCAPESSIFLTTNKTPTQRTPSKIRCLYDLMYCVRACLSFSRFLRYMEKPRWSCISHVMWTRRTFPTAMSKHFLLELCFSV